VVWLSAKAVWVSTTFVIVDICGLVSFLQLRLLKHCTYPISQAGDLLDLELRFLSDINQHPMPFLEFVDNTVVFLDEIDVLLQSILFIVSFALTVSVHFLTCLMTCSIAACAR